MSTATWMVRGFMLPSHRLYSGVVSGAAALLYGGVGLDTGQSMPSQKGV